VLVALILVGAALFGAPGAAAGPAVSTTTTVPYDGTNTCTGDIFTGTGTLHFLFSENLSSSGVLEHHLDARLDGLQVVTTFPVAGKKYVVQDTFDDEFVFGSAAEETFDITAHFVRVGEDGTLVLGDDFYEYFRAHITANDTGVTSYSIRTNDMPCQ
jgi:hypothetical protein